jgi:hypothetical protein
VLGDEAVVQELIEQYAWVKEIEAWTVAVIEDRPADDVVRIYGGVPDKPVGEYLFAGMTDLQGDGVFDELRHYVQVVNAGRFVVALENNGWTGSLPDIARRCSAGSGQFFSVYWNVNAYGFVTQAIDGEVTARFDFLSPISLEPPQAGERRPAWAVGPDTDVHVVRQTCFALLEQQTGVTVDPSMLAVPRPTFEIPDPHAMLRDVDKAEPL